jgi:hypothetical protein
MGWLVFRSVSSILFSRLEGFLDRGLGWSLSRSRWWWRLVFPDRCRVVCLVFLCVGVVGVFFELFVFFGGVLVVFAWVLVEGGGFGVWSLLVCMWLYCCLLSGAVLV